MKNDQLQMADLDPFRCSSHRDGIDLLTQLSDELRAIVFSFTENYKSVPCTRLGEETFELIFYPTETFSGFLDYYFTLFENRLDLCRNVEEVCELLFDAADHTNVDFYDNLSLINNLSLEQDQIAKEYVSEFIQEVKVNITEIIGEFEYDQKTLCESAFLFSNKNFEELLLRQTRNLSIAKKRGHLLIVARFLRGCKLDKPYQTLYGYKVNTHKWNGDQSFSNTNITIFLIQSLVGCKSYAERRSLSSL